MPEGALIIDRAYCDSAEWRNQAREAGGFGRGAAWVDLLALVNQRATTFLTRGIQRPVERGQSCFSKLALSERWGWSQGKVAACLSAWEKMGRIAVESGNDGTTITVLNYDAYQTGLLQALCEQNGSKLRTDREQTETEKGEGVGSTEVPNGVGGGKGAEPPAPEIPADQVIRDFCETWPGDIARGIPEGIPEVWWSGWVAHQLNGAKKWPANWQRVLVLAFRSDFIARHPKALAGVLGNASTQKNGGGESVASRRYRLDKELALVRARLEAAYETNSAADPADERREAEIEAEIKTL